MMDSTCDAPDLPRIKDEFERDGFVLLPDFAAMSTMSLWKSFTENHFSEVFRELHTRGHVDAPTYRGGGDCISEVFQYTMLQGAKNGFREIVMRSPGRFEVSLLHLLSDENSVQRKDLAAPALDAFLRSFALLVPSLLDEPSWGGCHVLGVSYVVSTPGAVEQAWHADGGHVDLHRHLACHCLNVFLPVDDLTPDLGPTEFRPGSHFLTRNLAPLMLAAKARKSLRPPCCPMPRRGDALIFDYRVLHRGKSNLSTKNRTYLVFTVGKAWFKDVVNFPKRTLYDPPQSLPRLLHADL